MGLESAPIQSRYCSLKHDTLLVLAAIDDVAYANISIKRITNDGKRVMPS